MDRPTSWRTADFRFPEFDTGKLAFELSDYQHDDGPSRAPTLRMEPLPTSRSNTWKAKAGELPLSGSIWVGLILSFVPYSLYIVKSLMDDDPPANWILLSASNANLLISVLSQLFVFSLSIVIGSTLDALRWQLASSDRGISLETFFGLSRATQLLPALRIMRSWRPSLLLLCHFRVWFPLLGIFLGSVLKFGAAFQETFFPGDKEVTVFAGLIPLDQAVLGVLPPFYLCTYLFGWMVSLTTTSKYATRLGTSPCGDNCTAIFLPGGLEVVRQVRPTLNQSILQGGMFQGAEAVRINSAPGFHLQFEQTQSGFQFDLDKECLEFGQHINESVVICVRTVGPSLAVGWTTCPSALYDNHNCTSDSEWKLPTARKSLRMTAFKRYSTTIYSTADLSIQQVTPLTPPSLLPLNESDYRALWHKAFDPASNDADAALVSALTRTLAWLLRLDDDFFSDDTQTPQAQLRNFLAVPLQFMATCWQYANYTVAQKGFSGVSFPMAPDTLATAGGGRLRTRLVVLPWTTWVFVGAGTALLVMSGGLFVWVFASEEPLPKISGVPELDILSRGGEHGAAEGPRGADADADGEMTLVRLVREYNLDERPLSSLFDLFKKRRLKLVFGRSSDNEDGKARLVVLREGSSDETRLLGPVDWSAVSTVSQRRFE